jgi:hypothetical protein
MTEQEKDYFTALDKLYVFLGAYPRYTMLNQINAEFKKANPNITYKTSQLLNDLVERGFLRTMKTNYVGQVKYVYVSRKNTPLDQELKNEADLIKKNNRDELQDEKLATDVSIGKWQKKTYWWVFCFAVLTTMTTIILAIDKLTTKPVIQKVYIPVDSQGKTIQLLPQTFPDNSLHK